MWRKQYLENGAAEPWLLYGAAVKDNMLPVKEKAKQMRKRNNDDDDGRRIPLSAGHGRKRRRV
jgi:hypothetical protein